MLLIDVPVGLIAGQVIADAGRNMLKSCERQNYLFLRSMTITFSFCFITPIVIYFFVGWPGWETNYFFKQADYIQNNPTWALISGICIVAMALIPPLLGLESGKYLIRREKGILLRISYLCLGFLILIIVYLSREATFNVAVTREEYHNGNTFSFFENPFFMFWLVLTILYWGSLYLFYVKIRKQDKEV